MLEKDPQDIDVVEVTISGDWLGGDTLTGVTLAAPESSGLSLGPALVASSSFSFTMQGGNYGTHKIDLTLNTSNPNKRRNRSILVHIKDR